MTFTIAGATGHVGSAAAAALLAARHPTRVVVRDPSRLPGALAGASVAQAELGDRAGLGAALAGSSGCFVLLPFDPTATGIAEREARMIDAITGAVADARVPHVVLLSSLGADAQDGPEILGSLHALEQGLRAAGPVVSTLRSTHFQEKVEEVLGAAEAGVYPVFGDDLDTAVPMVATGDVGATVASMLTAPPVAHEVVDILGPAYSERQIAALVGAAIGRELEITPVPRPAWVETLVDAGLSGEAAHLVAELYEASSRGALRPVGDRQIIGETPIGTTLDRLLRPSPGDARGAVA